MRFGLLLLTLLSLAACGRGDDAPPVARAETPDRPTESLGADLEPDPEPFVFDTTEPSPTTVEIPPQPPPLESTPPPPAPAPKPGSCDVRSTESFCFTYTGSGWTPKDAQEQCSEAPSSRYRQDACPTVNRIATCVFRRPSDPTLEIVYTYYAPYDLGLAEVACPGEFTRH